MHKFLRIFADTFDEKQVQDSTNKKQELIELANSGAKRPSCKTKLGDSLFHYIKEYTKTYDKEFTKQIKSIRPDWFENTSDTKKQELIELANIGGKKPSQKTNIGKCLCNYIYSKTTSYDKEFTKKIKSIRPDWFENTADTKKQELMELANIVTNRPSSKTKIGICLCNYININKKTYDKKFTKKIKSIRPDWFRKKSDINKEIIIKLAKNGGNRPSRKTKIGWSLVNYIYSNSGSYDAEFTKKIKSLRPDWFRK